MNELKINKTFRDQLPQLPVDKYQKLEKAIITLGCFDPIRTWKGFIIDGHHRYEICMRLKINFHVEEREFEDEDSAMLWMIDNQAKNRRNLTTAAKIRLAMKKMDIFKNRAEKRMKSGGYECKGSVKHPSADLREGKGKAAEKIAKEAGPNVSTRVVEQFMYIEKHAPEKLVNDLCEGKIVTDEKGKKHRLTVDGVYRDVKDKKLKEELHHKLESIEGKEAKATLQTSRRSLSTCVTVHNYRKVPPTRTRQILNKSFLWRWLIIPGLSTSQ